MGMTIDEAMENIHAIQAYYNDEMQDGYVGFAKEDNESVDLAIETMRKYQKIAEIVTNNELEWGNASVRANAFLEVKKVVEDGNNYI